MKKYKKFLSIVACFVVLCLSCLTFVGCGKNDNSSNPDAPVYTGMEVVDSAEISEASAVAFSSQGNGKKEWEKEVNYNENGYNGNHYGNNKPNKDRPFNKEDEDGNPVSQPSIEDEITSSFEIQGTELERYYADKSETVVVKVLFTNPKQYEIFSFTINGELFQIGNPNFTIGKNSACVYIDLDVGDEVGLQVFTIDAIKYVDGTEFKDVKIDGDKTIIIGVRGEGMPKAIVTNETITLTSIKFDVNITDEYSLISGKVNAYLYDGDSIIGQQELNLGNNSVEFKNLSPNTIYQYAICGVYDDFVEGGEKLRSITKNAFYTDAILLFDNINVGKENLTFKYIWSEEYQKTKTIRHKLFDKTSGQEIVTTFGENAGVISLSALKSNYEYVIESTYKNLQNADETIYLAFKTAENKIPTIEISNVTSTENKIEFNYFIEDLDSVGINTIIKLKHLTEADRILQNLSNTVFEDLSDDSEYLIEITYIYNLNDGASNKTLIQSYSIKTIKEYEIIYELNGGTNSLLNNSYYTILDNEITLYSPSKENCIFNGWFLSNNFESSTKITKIDSAREKELKIYANWIEIKDGNIDPDGYKIIATKDYISQIALNSNLKGDKFRLYNDLDYNQTELTPISSFYGEFDGNGHIISNYISTGGLFKSFCGKVKNLGLENFTINYTSFMTDFFYCGALIDELRETGLNAPNECVVFNCYASGTITLEGAMEELYKRETWPYYIGGLIGGLYEEFMLKPVYVNNCYADVDISVTTTYHSLYVGGFIGRAGSNSNFENCYAGGNIIAVENYNALQASGFGNDGNFKNCFAYGNVSGYSPKSLNMAGFSTSNMVFMDNCYRYENQEIIDINASGGLIIYNSATPVSSENLTNETFLIENMKFRKFISEDDLKENPNNVWVFEDGKYPKLYFEI